MIDIFRPYMAPEAIAAVTDVLTPDAATGRLYTGQGARVEAFEAALQAFLGARREVLTTNSCTAALDLALHLCGVGGVHKQERSLLSMRADVVISTPMSCTASNTGVVTRGGQLLWADVDPLTGLIDPASVADRIDRSLARHGIEPQAIIAVDWGGHLCDYPALRRAARRGAVPIIQDAAHSFGATVDGRPFMATDRHGDLVTFSFQAIKTLNSGGDGGALLCSDGTTTDRARLLRWYGLDRRSSADYRCAIGLANLAHVERLLHVQRDNARFYGATLRHLAGALLSTADPDEGAAWWLYTLLVDDRAGFIAYLAERGVQASPVHARNDTHPAFQRATLEDLPLPGVDFFAAHEVAIPCGWWVTEREREHVAEAVIRWSGAHGGAFSAPVAAVAG